MKTEGGAGNYTGAAFDHAIIAHLMLAVQLLCLRFLLCVPLSLSA